MTSLPLLQQSDLNSWPTDANWRLKAIRATRGNRSRLGCIVIAVLGRLPKHPPRVRGLAVIMEDGMVVADMQLRGQKRFLATPLGHIVEIRDNFRGLADHCRFTDQERIELFEELRKWISKDYRAKSEI